MPDASAGAVRSARILIPSARELLSLVLHDGSPEGVRLSGAALRLQQLSFEHEGTRYVSAVKDLQQALRAYAGTYSETWGDDFDAHRGLLAIQYVNLLKCEEEDVDAYEADSSLLDDITADAPNEDVVQSRVLDALKICPINASGLVTSRKVFGLAYALCYPPKSRPRVSHDGSEAGQAVETCVQALYDLFKLDYETRNNGLGNFECSIEPIWDVSALERLSGADAGSFDSFDAQTRAFVTWLTSDRKRARAMCSDTYQDVKRRNGNGFSTSTFIRLERVGGAENHFAIIFFVVSQSNFSPSVRIL